MNTIANTLPEPNILLDVDVVSRKRVFERISELCAAHTQLDPDIFYHGLIQRERLGSTGLGEGIAIPHARLPELTKPLTCFLQLSKGVDFDAPDGQLVDLIFGLFVPESATEEHLNLLAIIARFFNDEKNRLYLREPHNVHDVFHYLAQMPE